MTVWRPVPLVFSREAIEAGLLVTHLRWLQALLDPPTAVRHRQRLVLGFTGFPGAGDRLSEQPVVRQWMRDLDRHWPFWFFFLDPRTPSLYGLMRLLCPLERAAHGWVVDDADYQHFLRSHFAAMNAVCGVLGDPVSTRTAMKEAIRHALL